MRKAFALTPILIALSLILAAQAPLPGALDGLDDAEQIEVLSLYAGQVRARLTALETAIDLKRQRTQEIENNYEGTDRETMLGLVRPKLDGGIAMVLSMEPTLDGTRAAWDEAKAAKEAEAAAAAEAERQRLEAAAVTQ